MATVWLGAVVSRMRDVNDRPYTVEFILPSWSVKHDIDFRRWLFGFGSRIVIEAPELFPTARSPHEQPLQFRFLQPRHGAGQ